MNRLLKKILDVKTGEWLRVVLMFLYIFLIIASLLIVKPVSKSLFLTSFGIAKLPYVYMLVAFFAALVTTIYARFSRSLRLNYLIAYSTLFYIFCLALFWILLDTGFRGIWFIYVFYIWVAIFGVIATSQFWLLANYVFDVRQAKRLFGIIGAGAISGGIFGGYLTNYLATIIGSTNLLFICIAFLSLCLLILRTVWDREVEQNYHEKTSLQQRKQQRKQAETANPIAIILNSPHLKYLASLVAVAVVVANIIDYQFSAVATETIPEKDELSAFFGFWLSSLSIVSLVIQLFFTNYILKSQGLLKALYFLPVGILVGSLAFLAAPVLWAAVLIKVADGGFKQSIHKAGLELLALPIPKNMKDKAKAFIDVFVDSFATGLGGLFIILSTGVLGLSTQTLSLVVIALVLFWFYLNQRVNREYINSFRLAIEKESIDLEELTINPNDVSVLNSLLPHLQRQHERPILYILSLIEHVQSPQLLPYLKRLLRHPSGEVRAKSLSLLQRYSDLDETTRSQIEQMATDANDDVRLEAISFLCAHAEDPLARLDHFLQHRAMRVRVSALMCAAQTARENGDFQERIDLPALFEQVYGNFDPERFAEDEIDSIKITAANVIGTANDATLYPNLRALLQDASLPVVQAALANAGRTRAPEFIPVVISHLTRKHLRKVAREALANFGGQAVEALAHELKRPDGNRDMRLAIPKVLSQIQNQDSVDLLMDNLNQPDLLLRAEIIRALNKLKKNMPSLRYNTQFVEKRILSETKNYYELLTYLYAQNGQLNGSSNARDGHEQQDSVRKARQLLIRALDERLENNLERIFTLLGLKYLPRDMENAYQGIRSNKSELRASAIEFLDNILDSELKKFIIPIIESNSPFSVLENVDLPFPIEIRSEQQCLSALLEGDDSWLKVCALYMLAEKRTRDAIANIRACAADFDPMVRETAEYALTQIKLAG